MPDMSKALPLLSAISIANREEFARSFPAGRVNSFHVMRLCVAPGGKQPIMEEIVVKGDPPCILPTCTSTPAIPAPPAKRGTCPTWTCGPERKALPWWAPGILPIRPGRQEMEEQLLPAEEGLYRLKEEFRLPCGVAGQRRSPVCGQRGDQLYLQAGGQDPEGAQCDLAPQPGGGGGALPPAGADRQYPLRRPPYPGPFQPRPAGDHPGGLPPGGVPPRPHLDAPLLPVRGLFRVRHPRGVLWGLDAPHPRGGDGAFLRPAHELAGVPAGRAAAGVPFRRHSPRSWAGRRTCWTQSSPTPP